MRTSSGTRIKGLASFIRGLGYVSSVLLGFILLFNEDTFFLGILVMIFGCISAWLSTILLEGFGELVENSHIIAMHLTGGASEDAVGVYTSPDLDSGDGDEGLRYIDVSYGEIKRLMDEQGLPYGEAQVLAKRLKKEARYSAMSAGDLVINTPDTASDERYCRACGATLLPEYAFCNHCGEPVK